MTRRHHADIAIAGLVLIGAVGWYGGLVNLVFEPNDVVKAIVWFASAFLGAQIARRVLPDLAIPEIAAAVTIAIVMGLKYHRADEAIDPKMLPPLAIGIVGAVVGGYAVRRPGSGRERTALLLLTAGTAGIGGAMLAIGTTILLGGSYGGPVGLALIGGLAAGGILSVWLVERIEVRHALIGQALALGGFSALMNADQGLGQALASLVFGAVIGAMVGGLGGLIGRAFKRAAARRTGKPELPEVRQVS